MGEIRTFNEVTMKVNIRDIGGETIRNTDVYQVIDNKLLNNLTLSKTILYPTKCTSGHSHLGLEEVYMFVKGFGKMQLDHENTETMLSVRPGDIVLIPDGAFHKVYNDSLTEELEFVCVFQSYER